MCFAEKEYVMGPVNIYAITRVRDEELFNIVEKHEARVKDTHRIRIHEIDSLRILADALTGCGMSVSEADGFYFGFTIPQIGKEFDLLKVTDRHCLNIELKSQDVSEDAILAQLRKNRHYLTHLGKRLVLFTVVTDSMTCYRLSLSDNLVRTDIREIAAMLKKCNAPYDEDISKSFRASEYLISPMNTPDKFIRGKYFLTPAQEYVRTELMKSIDSADSSTASGDHSQAGAFFHITGRPGTGKTLLLYDLAKSLSERGNAVIISCGELTEGERIISRELDSLDIVSSGDPGMGSGLEAYDYILADEAQRLDNEAFDLICRSVRANDQVCIFSSDPESVLTKTERDRDLAGRIRALPPVCEFELSERLRMNRELLNFIMTLKNLGHKSDRSYEYTDVSVNYARDTLEAMKLIAYYRSKGYVFINARSHQRSSSGEPDPFDELAEEFDVHQIIGREYDNVIMLMDSSFYYDENGYLKGIPAPDPDYLYPNLFYQGITRVREKLALVILDAPELFRNILGII